MRTRPPVVVVADDSATVRMVVAAELEGAGYAVVEAEDGAAAVAACRAQEVDVVLLDVEMPGMDGWAAVRALKADPATADLPVLFLTGRSSTEDVVTALDLGAHDVVRKPPEPAELRARIAAAVRVKDLQDALRDRAAELERISATDALTGLPNRRFAQDRLAAALSEARRHGHELGVLLVDVDRFKAVNDELGHAAGDAVLQAVAARLREGARVEDVVARWGGEEFVVVAGRSCPRCARVLAERLRRAVSASAVEVDGRAVAVTASVGGVGGAVDESVTADRLLATADANLYAAKRDGRDRAVVTSTADGAVV